MGLDVSSHLHPVGSFDLADHPVPTGREEVWRFTPLKRLRGLHDEAAADRRRLRGQGRGARGRPRAESVEAPTSGRGPERLRADRPRQRPHLAAAPRACSRSRCPPTPRWPSRSWSTFTGNGARPTRGGAASCWSRSARTRRPPWWCGSTGSATLRRQRRDRARRRRPAHLRHPPGLGRRRRAPLAPSARWSVATPRSSTWPSPSAAAWSATTSPRRTTAPAATSRCSASTSPTPGSTSSTASSSTTTRRKTRSRVTYKGALQGQGAHTVWIGNVLIRKEAEGIDTYEENRNLVLTDGCQADSVPNLEIETGEIAGRRPRLGDGPLRRRAAVLPALARHRGEGSAPPGRARLLQRPDPPDRRARARGAAGRHGRGRAVQERPEGRLMAFLRACALADIHDDAALGVHRRRPGRRPRPPRRGDLRRRGHVQPRQRRAERGRYGATDCTVECWLHGSRFDLRTGKPTGLPATEPVATFPVDVRDGDVYVDIETIPERSHPA